MSDKEKQPEAVTPQQVTLDQAPIEALLEELVRLQDAISTIKAEIIRRTKVK